MNHYAGQGLEREPFANSPDPSFLLGTRQHATCLQELEISLRLRRGLNVVTGDIGTGKTTLCRSLLRAFAEDRDADVHLLLDPHFETSEEFVRVILGSVAGHVADESLGLWQLKEILKQQLFRLSLVDKRLVILIIDEGQKISKDNLEILREMLNYETNTAKLLQIVIFGQRELEPLLAAMPNLADRINVRRRLGDLSLAETRRMIAHRLAVAAGEGGRADVGFSAPAALAVHLASGGSPRKIVRLCHMAMLEMLVRGKNRVGLAEVRVALKPAGHAPANPRRTAGLAALAALLLVCGALWLSLGRSGPVLGTLPQPSAAAETASGAAEQPFGALNGAQKALVSDAAALPQGLTLRSEAKPGPERGPGLEDGDAALARSAASRVSLLPQRDQGPDVRERVGEGRPPLLNVSLPEADADAHAQTARPATLVVEARTGLAVQDRQ